MNIPILTKTSILNSRSALFSIQELIAQEVSQHALSLIEHGENLIYLTGRDTTNNITATLVVIPCQDPTNLFAYLTIVDYVHKKSWTSLMLDSNNDLISISNDNFNFETLQFNDNALVFLNKWRYKLSPEMLKQVAIAKGEMRRLIEGGCRKFKMVDTEWRENAFTLLRGIAEIIVLTGVSSNIHQEVVRIASLEHEDILDWTEALPSGMQARLKYLGVDRIISSSTLYSQVRSMLYLLSSV